MRGLLGFVIFIAAIATLQFSANSQARLHCEPVLAPPPPNCTTFIGKLPIDCHRAESIH